RPPTLGLPLRVGVAPAFGGNRSASFMPTAARIAAVSQPAWHFTRALPSSPWATLRLARRSSWTGQRADQPLPTFLASDNLVSRVSRGVIARPPSPGLPAGSAKLAVRPRDTGPSCESRCRRGRRGYGRPWSAARDAVRRCPGPSPLHGAARPG